MIEIDGFEQLQPIGQGGLGDVYRAERTSTGGTVAIKVLRDVSDSSVAWHRTRRELTALVSLSGHGHVVRLLELLELPGGPALVMEYAPGGSVADLLASRGDVLDIGEVVLIGRQAADALDAAHDQDIVHRDVKPQNLLIDGYGQVKLCDFGIASLARSEEFRTRTSAISMRYASPEDLDEDADVGPPSDVYSLGATLLHLSHGAPPTLKARLAPWAPPPHDDADPGQVALDEVIASCLEPDPDERPSAADVLHRLEEIDWSLTDRCRALPVEAPTGSRAAELAPVEPAATPEPAAVPGPGPIRFGDDTSAPTVQRGEPRPMPARPIAEPRRAHRWTWVVAAVAIAALVGVVLALVWPNDADAPDTPEGSDAVTEPTFVPSTTAPPTSVPSTSVPTTVELPPGPTVALVDRPDDVADPNGDEIVWPLGTAGECLVLLPGAVELTPIGCDEPHDFQRITVATLDAAAFPPDAPFEFESLRVTIDDLCRLEFAEFVGVAVVDSEFDVAVTRPSAETWTEGDRAYQCLVGVPGTRLVGDAAGTAQ